jgi:hypothetical protein
MTKSNLHIECNHHQISDDIPHRSKKNNPKIHMKVWTKRLQIVKTILNQKSNAALQTIPDFKSWLKGGVLGLYTDPKLPNCLKQVS